MPVNSVEGVVPDLIEQVVAGFAVETLDEDVLRKPQAEHCEIL